MKFASFYNCFILYLTEKFQVAAVDVDCLELFCVERSHMLIVINKMLPGRLSSLNDAVDTLPQNSLDSSFNELR